MALFLPQRWRQIPTESTVLDWSSPFANGLFFASAHNSLAPTVFTKQGNFRFNAQTGLTVKPALVAGALFLDRGFIDYGSLGANVQSDITVLSFLRPTATGNPYERFTIGRGSDSSGAGWSIGLSVTESTGIPRCWAVYTDGGAAGYPAVGSTNVLLKDSVLVGVIRPFVDVKLYVNGVQDGVITTATKGTFRTSAVGWNIGPFLSTALLDPYGVGFYYVSAVWNRALSPAEVKAISENPYQLFKKQSLKLFFTASGAVNQTLTPSLFTNTNTFYSATVTAGAVTLTPSLLTNTNTFYSATITQSGAAQTLTPSLFTNSNTFYSATVSAGAITLTPALFTNTNTFYSATVMAGTVLQPALFTNTNTFYSATVSAGAVTLTPALFTNSNAFYSATITQATQQTILPDLFVSTNQFYQAVVDDGIRRASQDATPGYATPRPRYRVRVGRKWIEVDPLDPVSVRRAYEAAQEDAQDVATQDALVETKKPQALATQAVSVRPIKGPDYIGLAKEARRISEDIRKVYADALQTELIARLMRERIEQDDEDDIAVLLASI